MRRRLPFMLVLTLSACDRSPSDHVATDGSSGDPDTDDAPARDTDRADTDPAAVDTDPPGPRWEIGPEVVCADPSARLTQPYKLLDGGPAWQAQPFDPKSKSVFLGGGVAVADFTGDGLLDLMITAADDRFGYWIQGPGLTFTDASATLPTPIARTAGVTAVDVDGDGDLDAFVAVYEGPDVLLINDGHGTFTDGTAGTGLAGPSTRRSMSSSWADLDHDGDLDAFVAGYGPISSADSSALPPGDPSSIFVNQGDGTWVDQVPGLTAPNPLIDAHTFSGAFVDGDRDGWLDLYLVHDFGWTWPSMLLHNDGGAMSVTPPVGVELARENMGLGIGDINGDLIPDFLVSAWEDDALFVSNGPQWFDESRTRGLRFDATRDQATGWGADLADLDDDGDLDAMIVFGYIPVSSGHADPRRQPDGVWAQQDNGTFVDVGAAWGLDDDGRGRGLVTVDLDRNGFLDIVRPDLIGPTDIRMGACDDSGWLGVQLREPGPNRFAIGAQVIVRDQDRVWSRDVRAGGTSYGSAGPPELHFGLGDRSIVDSVEIHWPDGTIDRRSDVPTRRWITVERR